MLVGSEGEAKSTEERERGGEDVDGGGGMEGVRCGEKSRRFIGADSERTKEDVDGCVGGGKAGNGNGFCFISLIIQLRKGEGEGKEVPCNTTVCYNVLFRRRKNPT